MAQIELKTIAKSFGQTEVLKNVDLNIARGEFVTLVGPSGCGKSTLLRILAGLEAADSGQVIIDDQDMTQVRPADRNLAMVFQSYALYPHLTVADNMMTPLKMRDLSRWERLPIIGPLSARARYRELLGQVHKAAETLRIEPLLDRKPGQLSGGQRQRAALGRALVRDPVAFLMDEPLSNLDAALRVHMRTELTELHRRLGTTFVYVTHDQAEALTMSDRMAVMRDGRILQVGPPDEIYNDPNTVEVAEFVGSPPINLLPGEVDRSGQVCLLGAALGHVDAQHAGPVMLGMRPETLSLGSRGIDARVVHRENLGADVFLHLTVASVERRLLVRVAPGTPARIGDHVRIVLDYGKVMVFGKTGHRLPFAARTMEKIA